MTAFLIGAIALVLFTLAFLVWPLLRRRPASADFSRTQLNTTIYRDQLAELERDRSEGSLSQTDYDQAKAELQRRMLEDTSGEESPAAAAVANTPGRSLPITLGVFIIIGSVLAYMALGNPQAINPPHQQRFDQAEIERMIADMAVKLEKEPENYKGWEMLARTYKVMGRYPDAVKAYARTGTLLDTSAELLVDYADAQAAVDKGFSRAVMVLIDKALKLDPANMQGLWLRGTAFFESQQYDKAVADWEGLLKLLPPDSEEARVITANLAEARGKGGLKPGNKSKVGAGETAKKTAANASITGRVELDPALAGKLPAGATVMVIARPADGSRMPVGVFVNKGKLPVSFTLDDSLAMTPDNPLSKHKELRIEARISQSGQAMAQPGDLFSAAQTVKLGAKNVVLKVDQVK
jgi:cytochrome c-type biogenesis protein CcmH